MTTLTPQQGVQKVIYSQLIKSITGKSLFDPENIRTYMKTAHAKSLKDLDPKAFILANAYNASNFNPYINMGGQAKATKLGEDSETQLQKDFMNKVADQLSKVTVETQWVNAANVTVMSDYREASPAFMSKGAINNPFMQQANKSGVSSNGIPSYTDAQGKPVRFEWNGKSVSYEEFVKNAGGYKNG
jgi:hypothetical protein